MRHPYLFHFPFTNGGVARRHEKSRKELSSGRPPCGYVLVMKDVACSLEDVLHAELEHVGLLHVATPVVGLYVVVVETKSHILVPEERQACGNIRHASGVCHAGDVGVLDGLGVVQVEIAVAQHELKVLV